MNQKKTISRSRFEAVIFDLDGVITRTARVHFSAWKQMFDEFLERRSENGQFLPFTDLDYFETVDGKPRYEGVKGFLDSRGIALPYGHPGDSSENETLCGLGNRKNEIFLQNLKKVGVDVFETSVELIRRLRSKGFRTAVVSSSKNGELILDAAHLADLFDVKVNGKDAVALDLKGKPDPDTFLEASRRLGVAPENCVIFEDAVAGVQAGRRGAFGLVVGVDRENHFQALKEAGADLVVQDLAEIQVRVRIQDLPSAVEAMETILGRIGYREVAVFLDYDGTLTPIVAHPEDAVLSEEMRQVLKTLAMHSEVAVVSGRGLKDVRERVGIDSLFYAGSHGFEIAGPANLNMEHEGAKESLADLKAAEKMLGKRLKEVPGVQIEPKRFSLAVHFRNVPEDRLWEVERAVEQALQEHPKLRRGLGKKVYDLQPDVEWDKGRALFWILERLKLKVPHVLPIYLGDDLTDEDAFAALEGSGVGIVVGDGDRDTAAEYRVDDGRVGDFLGKLGVALKGRRPWTLVYREFDPPAEGLREALCTLGNGFFATRGAAPESRADPYHYPGTYVAGGYNRLKTAIAGRTIENEDLINLPNWLIFDFRIPGAKWFQLEDQEILFFRQHLDLKRGLLRRTVDFRDPEGRETRLTQRRIVSMAEKHLAALETTLIPLNWSGTLEVRSGLDGQVSNAGVARYQALNGRHLEPVETRRIEPGILLLQARTYQSRFTVALAERLEVFQDNRPVNVDPQIGEETGRIFQGFTLEVEQGKTLSFEKTTALYTSRDFAISECGQEAVVSVREAGRFERLLEPHVWAWRHLWRKFEIRLELSEDEEGLEAQRILRLYSFHLLQSASRHTLDIDAGIPARGWHGEAYRGHIFWDEVVIFPFFNLRVPEITRTLLLYRYRRLKEARKAAQALGLRGAMFPWQSGSNGREESQEFHLNPSSGRWLPDHSRLQRHINAAIVYNIWQYFQVTGDLEFLFSYGGEMILEIARFWASLASYNEEIDRYEILGVMGPDEFHDAYPDAESPGLNNNAYTNLMAVFVLNKALDLFHLLPSPESRRLCEKLGIEASERARWEEIRRKMRVLFHDDGIISQFEGYEKLQEFDWEGYRKKYENVQRLDRILEKEGDSVNRYKASKQADVLMLFYLFSSEELVELFAQLGYSFDPEQIPKNIDYYLKRTSDGSSLSWIIHAWVATRRDREHSWKLFNQALKTDMADIQGGTTAEGVHLGAMAGCVDLVHRCYTGLETRGQLLRLNPRFPKQLKRIHMHLRYRGNWLELDISSQKLKIESLVSGALPVKVEVQGQQFELERGEVREIELT